MGIIGFLLGCALFVLCLYIGWIVLVFIVSLVIGIFITIFALISKFFKWLF